MAAARRMTPPCSRDLMVQAATDKIRVTNVTEGRAPTMLAEGARRFCKRPGALP
jgi:hypothetical protein